MEINDRITKRFEATVAAGNNIRIDSSHGYQFADIQSMNYWATLACSTVQDVFGKESMHYLKFKSFWDTGHNDAGTVDAMKGVFHAAKNDFENGYTNALRVELTGEVLGDFVLLGKQALNEGNKDTAAVLACAALEDALKRFAENQGLQVEQKTMQEVVNAMKGAGLVQGAQKSLLDTMPKIRNSAMHADWEKIAAEDVRAVLGFVEQFLVSRFS